MDQHEKLYTPHTKKHAMLQLDIRYKQLMELDYKRESLEKELALTNNSILAAKRMLKYCSDLLDDDGFNGLSLLPGREDGSTGVVRGRTH